MIAVTQRVTHHFWNRWRDRFGGAIVFASATNNPLRRMVQASMTAEPGRRAAEPTHDTESEYRAMTIRLCLLAACLAAPTAFAQLKWDTTAIEIKATQKDKKVRAVYKFENVGNQPVKIKEVKTSCGCTTASLAKKTYAPGERGEISATMTLPTEGGTRKKSIYVHTDDPQNPTYTLSISGSTPAYLALSARSLQWNLNDPLTPKSLVLSAGTERAVKITKLTVAPAEFEIALETIEEGREYKVTVTPSSTARVRYGVVNIETDLPEDVAHKFRAYAQILKP